MVEEKIVPVLVHRDIGAAHDFLVNAFGFRSGIVQRDDSGAAVHGEVQHGGDTIWLHRESEDHGMAAVTGLVRGGLAVQVSDVDRHWQRARDAGADVRGDPQTQPYGQREYEAIDPEGRRWWFYTPCSLK